MFGLFYQTVVDEEESRKEIILRRQIRCKTTPLDIPDPFFLQNFRISKEIFLYLLEAITPHLKPEKTKGICMEDKLAACLRFFAEGKYQYGIGKDYHIAIARSTFSKVLTEIIPALEKAICSEWISLHMTDDEKNDAQSYFFEKSGIRDVIMSVDGTHIRIIKPADRHLRFCNRKKFYSLNVMIVCDNKSRIRAVDARYPGANHDAHVWRMSLVRSTFQEWHNSGNIVKILGDSGYPAEPWLIRPHRAPEPGSVEFAYNSRHASGRCIVERTIGLLKNKFRCLLGVNGQLNYSPEKSGRIINICCALHNICIQHNL